MGCYSNKPKIEEMLGKVFVSVKADAIEEWNKRFPEVQP